MANKTLHGSHASSESTVNVKSGRKRVQISTLLVSSGGLKSGAVRRNSFLHKFWLFILMGRWVLEGKKGPGLLQIKMLNLGESKSLNLSVKGKLKDHLFQLLIFAGNCYSVLSSCPRSSLILPTYTTSAHPFSWAQFFLRVPARFSSILCSLILVVSTGIKHEQNPSSNWQLYRYLNQSVTLSRVNPIYT